MDPRNLARTALALTLGGLALSSCVMGGTGTAAVTTDYELRTRMRELWDDHTTWTRIVLIDMAAGLPDTDVAVARLWRNQDEIGDAMRPFYGDVVADQLTALLHAHVTGAADVIVAAQSGDTAAFDAANAAWYANGHAIADRLASANGAWDPVALREMMEMHLDAVLMEASLRLSGDFAGEAAQHDAVVEHARHMADVLAAGIGAQFPGLVAVSTMSRGEQELHVATRALWHDHVAWTRFYLIEALAALPAAPFTAERLLHNQDEIGAAAGTYYGSAAGRELALLLREHVGGAADVIAAAEAGDTAALDAALAAWHANADQIAEFLAAANPNWSRADLAASMHHHLEQTAAEASARLHGNWETDVMLFDQISAHMARFSDTVSAGIAVQFRGQVG